MDKAKYWTMDQPGQRSGDLNAYLEHLEALPFVVSAQADWRAESGGAAGYGLSLRTNQKKLHAPLFVARTNLTAPLVAHVVHAAAATGGASSRPGPVFLFAPRISSRWGVELEEGGVNYVDAAGNCHVALGKQYVAHVEGKKLDKKPAAAKGMRAKALLVLFALLTDKRLVDVPVRAIASAAGGVSPQTVSDVRNRLVHEGWVIRHKRRHHWAPRGRESALNLLLGSYEQLAAYLQLGRFEPRPMPLPDFERALEQALSGNHFRFGGGAALHRLNGYYRGTRTIVYVEESSALSEVENLLVPRADGEVIFSRFPGTIAVDEQGQISPLLVYLDLMTEGEPRAREAAAELRQTLFQEDK